MRKNSLKSSFYHAFAGIVKAVRQERNMALHFCIAFMTLATAIIVGVDSVRILFLFFACGFVISAEMFNTAIEKTLDFISKEKSNEIKFIKDVAAAGVLIASVVAFIVGIFVFFPIFYKLMNGGM